MITIGKANDNEYVVNDPSVSRHHAQLTYEEEGHWILEDLGSTNGTFVNGIQIARKNSNSKEAGYIQRCNQIRGQLCFEFGRSAESKQ